jgi:hypothetical protein
MVTPSEVSSSAAGTSAKTWIVLAIAVVVFAASVAMQWEFLTGEWKEKSPGPVDEKSIQEEADEALALIERVCAEMREEHAEEYRRKLQDPQVAVEMELDAMEKLAEVLQRSYDKKKSDEFRKEAIRAAAHWGLITHLKDEMKLQNRNEALAEAEGRPQKVMDKLHYAQGTLSTRPGGLVLLVFIDRTLKEMTGRTNQLPEQGEADASSHSGEEAPEQVSIHDPDAVP